MSGKIEVKDLVAKIEKIEVMIDQMSKHKALLMKQKRELIACLTDVGKEVGAAGGHYLVDKIQGLMKSILDEDIQLYQERTQP